jgi:hypothetical protein
MLMISPTQRLARYPLLLREAIKYTTDAHNDRHVLSEALNLFSNVCNKINSTKAAEDKKERRIFLEQHAVSVTVAKHELKQYQGVVLFCFCCCLF